MRRIVLSIALTLFGGVGAAYSAPDLDTELEPTELDAQVANYVAKRFANEHPDKKPIDDKASESMHDVFIKSLDPRKIYFLQEDIAEFEKFKLKHDDALLGSDLSHAFFVYNRFRTRVKERMEAFQNVDLKLDVSEVYNTDLDKLEYGKDDSGALDLMRKSVKYRIIQKMRTEGISKEDVVKEMEKVIDCRADQMGRRSNDFVVEAYLRSLGQYFDPHTTYFSPKTAEGFSRSLQGEFVGMGIQFAVMSAGEYPTVRKILDGPSKGILEEDDVLLEVSRGEDEPTSLFCRTNNEILDTLLGKKGDVNKLKIRRDGEEKSVEVKLGVVKTEQPTAVYLPDAKIAVIRIPAFNQKRNKYGLVEYSMARVVQAFVKQAKENGAEGIVLDLRGNGGGSVSEAVHLTSLFVGRETVTQFSNGVDNPQILNGRRRVRWEGPLVVVVDRGSASASEIFSAAMRQHQRALVVGETTFGKGSMQHVAGTNKDPKNMLSPTLNKGIVKITQAGFFGANGRSPQGVGVSPHIEMKTASSVMFKSEADFDNALTFKFTVPEQNMLKSEGFEGRVAEALKLHKERSEGNRRYQAIGKKLDEFKLFLESKEITLTLDAAKERAKKRKRMIRSLERLGVLDEEFDLSRYSYEPYTLEVLSMTKDWMKLNKKVEEEEKEEQSEKSDGYEADEDLDNEPSPDIPNFEDGSDGIPLAKLAG